MKDTLKIFLDTILLGQKYILHNPGLNANARRGKSPRDGAPSTVNCHRSTACQRVNKVKDDPSRFTLWTLHCRPRLRTPQGRNPQSPRPPPPRPAAAAACAWP